MVYTLPFVGINKLRVYIGLVFFYLSTVDVKNEDCKYLFQDKALASILYIYLTKRKISTSLIILELAYVNKYRLSYKLMFYYHL